MSETNPDDLKRAIVELERLLALATPGEWQVEGDGPDLYVGSPRPDNTSRIDDVLGNDQATANAELIVAMKNSLPLILAAAARDNDVVKVPTMDWGGR